MQSFDIYANPVWLLDERGFIHYTGFDIPTGTAIQTIADFNTSLSGQPTPPAGWTTPSGGGLNLITDMTVDLLGRTVLILYPWHTIDIGGVATWIRRATFFVYQDGEFQTWVGQGYATDVDGGEARLPSATISPPRSVGATAYSFTLINPVSITITDEVGHVTDQIQAIRSYTAGPLVSTDSFPQSTYCRWTNDQWTDCCKVAITRQYFFDPGDGRRLAKRQLHRERLRL